MKKAIAMVAGLLVLLLVSCREGNREGAETYVEHADYIQIVLFHLAQRCESCNAVEYETEQLLKEEYSEEVDAGKIKFIPLNFQSEHGKQAARLLKASGQTLFVVKGDHVEDLTSPAFMYASTRPEYYRDELREALDTFLE
jgi:hypothetical protein